MERTDIIVRLNTVLTSLWYHAQVKDTGLMLAGIYNYGKYVVARDSITKKATKAGVSYATTKGILGAPESIVADIMKDWDAGGLGPKDTLNILKKNHKVAQHGGGKGKALIILSPVPFTNDDTIVGFDDTSVKVKPSKQTITEQQLLKEIEALKKQREKDKKTIGQLKSDLMSKSQHSWG